MATLTNPVTEANIIARYKDYVTNVANASIVWGTNNNPTYSGFEVIADSYFGGTTSGVTAAITDSDLGGDPITASTIYSAMVTETNRYTKIRKLQARLNIEGSGGNTGSWPTAGIVYDDTQIAHMSDSYLQSVGSPANAGVASGNAISSSNLESFFSNLQSAYNTDRNTVVTITTSTCHASCHSSCHGSRSRR